ncbi:MAG TPA: hypothetical protein VD788_09275 [Candidatus Polarisedimenticolaceae bacterium]|nr:hypothetical protein [Candidatus Polarisedimenticolaceae bacterium]
MVRTTVWTLTLAIACVAAGTASAAMLSKTYEFNPDAILEIGASTGDGLRLDTVRFQMPTTTGVRTASEASVEIAISNTSEESKRVGIGVALFDSEGRLVGVASGGTRLVGLKPDKQKSYKLIFADLNVEAPRAATFQISVESRP